MATASLVWKRSPSIQKLTIPAHHFISTKPPILLALTKPSPTAANMTLLARSCPGSALAPKFTLSKCLAHVTISATSNRTKKSNASSKKRNKILTSKISYSCF